MTTQMDTPILYNTIYNENCLDTMARMPDEFVDMVVTSPPYDNLRSYQESIKNWNFDTFKKIANELTRTLKQGGVICWVVRDPRINMSLTLSSHKQALYFKKLGLKVLDIMIYQKEYVRFFHPYYYPCGYENIYVFSKGIPKSANLIRDRGNNVQYIKRTKSKVVTRATPDESVEKASVTDPYYVPLYGLRSNVWKYSTGYFKSTLDKEAYQHPAIYPEQLARDLIITWSKEGDLIYDPFLGSGTTTKMAILLKRKYMGSEIVKTYFDIAERRNAKYLKALDQLEIPLDLLDLSPTNKGNHNAGTERKIKPSETITFDNTDILG